MSKVLQWRFEKFEGTWYWTAGELTTPIGPFPTFISCLVDAQENGLFAQAYERRKISGERTPAVEHRLPGRPIGEGFFAPTLVGH
jgi:hypothetical protein